MVRRKTDKEFKKEVYDLIGNEYTFLDTYVNSQTKIKVKHNKCDNTYEVSHMLFFMEIVALIVMVMLKRLMPSLKKKYMVWLGTNMPF